MRKIALLLLTVGIASPVAAATLDRLLIESTIEKHFDEVMACYEEGLGRNAELAGKVTMRIAIGSKGEVPAASVAETTLKDATVEACITKAVKTWTFPKPKGKGLVWAVYPFVLKTK